MPFQIPPPVPEVDFYEQESYKIQKQSVPKVPKVYKYAYLFDDNGPDGPINQGKRYAEYLADALKRPTEKRYYEIYYGTYDGPPTNGILTYAPEDTEGE